nr:MMPL family transporter [Streptomyces prunicolor]
MWGAALGIGELVFGPLFGFQGADPVLGLLSFVFLVALGVDYGIFLMHRMREEAIRGAEPVAAALTALRTTARAGGAKVDLSVEAAAGIPAAVGAAAYRIVQEALTNAVRHGGRADLTVRVGVHERDGALRVDVTDDGAGTGDGTPGFGLVGMRERVRSVGGTLDAGPLDELDELGERAGFAVTAVLPLRARGEEEAR